VEPGTLKQLVAELGIKHHEVVDVDLDKVLLQPDGRAQEVAVHKVVLEAEVSQELAVLDGRRCRQMLRAGRLGARKTHPVVGTLIAVEDPALVKSRHPAHWRSRQAVMLAV